MGGIIMKSPSISLNCRKPKSQWISKKERNIKGNKLITLTRPQDILNWEESKIRCQKCLPCALHKAAQTGVRATDEIACYPDANLFITLTVSDEYLEEVFPNGEIQKRPFQLFMKRLQKRQKGIYEIKHPRTGKMVKPIRALYCGEYGEQTLRPHYHAIIFNWKPEDLTLMKSLRQSKQYENYQSDLLEQLWPYGQIHIGEASFEASGYIARYTAKKYLQQEDPRLKGKTEAFIEYPRGYGLGRLTYDKRKEQMFNLDFKYVKKSKERFSSRGTDKPFKVAIPQYYNRLRKAESPESYEEVVDKRVKRGQEKLLREYKGSHIYQKLREKTKADITDIEMKKRADRTL